MYTYTKKPNVEIQYLWLQFLGAVVCFYPCAKWSEFVNATSSNKSANVWHERMGHISQGCLQTMVYKHIPIRLFNLNDTKSF